MTNAPLHVLFLIDSFRMGGAECITVALLPHFDRSRVTPLVCTLNTHRESSLVKQLGDVPRFDLGLPRMVDLAGFRRLLRLLRDERIDLIHAQLQDSTILAAIAGKLTGIPVVVTRHLIEDSTRNWRKRWRNRLEKFAIKWGVACIITVSNAARDAYAQRTGLPLSRFETIYNGIEVERFGAAEDKSARRRELNLPIDAPLVAMVGVLRPGKGQDVCIQAARQLPGVHFLLVGDGPCRADLEAQSSDVRDRVHFLGERMDVPVILSASDMLVLPSDIEALPTVLIEAGASKLPVVASRVGGIPEIVDDGLTGILVPARDPLALAEAIQELLDAPDVATKMGERAYQKVRTTFSLSNQVATLTRLYEKVVESR